MEKKNFTQSLENTIADPKAKRPKEEKKAEEQKPKRARRAQYTDEEKEQFMATMKTSGRGGLKLPRINLAFTPENYEYIQIMSRVSGESMTQFVNYALHQHMKEHMDVYEKAIEFRNSL